MEDYTFLKDKKISMVVTNVEKENDVRVYLGEIVEIEKRFHFVNKSENWNVLLNPDKLEELQEVPEVLKEILLGGDYFLPMTIGSLPNNSAEGFNKTGMNWNT